MKVKRSIKLICNIDLEILVLYLYCKFLKECESSCLLPGSLSCSDLNFTGQPKLAVDGGVYPSLHHKATLSWKFGHCYFLHDIFDALCGNY